MDQPFSDRDVALGPDHIIGAAVLCPGWSGSGQRWKLTIDSNGLCIQEVSICHPDNTSEVLVRSRQLSAEELQRLRELITDVEFNKLDSEYDEGWSSDDTTTIVVRDDAEAKQVYAYDANFAANDGSDEMKRYVRLWDRLVQLSPINTEDWKVEEADRQKACEIDVLSRRAAEADFQQLTVGRIFGAVFGVPAVTFLLQALYPKFDRLTPTLPTWVEFITFTVINYVIVVVMWCCVGFQRRRERRQTEETLKVLTSAIEAQSSD